jgi:WD40 repeat protein
MSAANTYTVGIDLKGDRYFVGYADGRIGIYNWASGTEIRMLNGHRAFVTCIDVDTEQHLLFSGSDDHTIRIWCLETGCCLVSVLI